MEVQAADHLSNADVAGAWGWIETGTVIPSTGAVPFAFVARYTLDADGNLSGTETSSSDGNIANLTLKGTGTVNSAGAFVAGASNRSYSACASSV